MPAKKTKKEVVEKASVAPTTKKVLVKKAIEEVPRGLNNLKPHDWIKLLTDILDRLDQLEAKLK